MIVTLKRAKVYTTVSGNSPQTRYFPEAASQDFKAGQFVALDAENKLEEADADSEKVFAMAVIDASGVEDTMLPVHILNSDTEFELNVYFDGDADADDAVARSHINSMFGMAVVDNKCHVDLDTTGNTNLLFIGKDISLRDRAGDIYGRLVVNVIPSKVQTLNDAIA